jgi:hypothetical protein
MSCCRDQKILGKWLFLHDGRVVRIIWLRPVITHNSSGRSKVIRTRRAEIAFLSGSFAHDDSASVRQEFLFAAVWQIRNVGTEVKQGFEKRKVLVVLTNKDRLWHCSNSLCVNGFAQSAVFDQIIIVNIKQLQRKNIAFSTDLYISVLILTEFHLLPLSPFL